MSTTPDEVVLPDAAGMQRHGTRVILLVAGRKDQKPVDFIIAAEMFLTQVHGFGCEAQKLMFGQKFFDLRV